MDGNNKSSYVGHLRYGDCTSLINRVLGGVENEKKEEINYYGS